MKKSFRKPHALDALENYCLFMPSLASLRHPVTLLVIGPKQAGKSAITNYLAGLTNNLFESDMNFYRPTKGTR
jgi:polynucleotide 5'-kinase involved in rRNA processing